MASCSLGGPGEDREGGFVHGGWSGLAQQAGQGVGRSFAFLTTNEFGGLATSNRMNR
jgi:hypothetical protein